MKVLYIKKTVGMNNEHNNYLPVGFNMDIILHNNNNNNNNNIFIAITINIQQCL